MPDQRVPEGQVDDLQIAAQVKSKLATDIGVSSVTKISVNSTKWSGDAVGQVESDEVKAKAKSLAKTVSKVGRVVNSLQIIPRKVGVPCCGESSSYC
jgi:osmotically-inducible protein OsmY